MALEQILIFSADNLTFSDGNLVFDTNDTDPSDAGLTDNSTQEVFQGDQDGFVITIDDMDPDRPADPTNASEGEFDDGASSSNQIIQTPDEPFTLTGIDEGGNTVEITINGGEQIQAEFAFETSSGLRVIPIRITDDDGQLFTIGYTVASAGGEPVGISDLPPDGSLGTIDETITRGDTPYGDIICFTAGTLIETPRGWIPVEELAVGDTLATLDRGEQPIVWIGTQTFTASDLLKHPNVAPIRIPAGTLGATADLRVSPQHRLLLQSARAELMFGNSEVLGPATAFTGTDGIAVDENPGDVTYYHVALDHHAIVSANGVLTETFFGGALQAGHVADLDLDAPKSLSMMAPARPMLRVYEVRALLRGDAPLAEAV